MRGTVTVRGPIVEAELEALPADIRAWFGRITALIETQGLDRIRQPELARLRAREVR
jgi:hypothetical protein